MFLSNDFIDYITYLRRNSIIIHFRDDFSRKMNYLFINFHFSRNEFLYYSDETISEKFL